jgi:cytidylate kinase
MLLDMQRDVAKRHNVIMDGRDIGTVVLPKATVKIFLSATPEIRAQRRTDELIAKGQKADYQQILKEIKLRDYQDSNRPIAPLKQAKDAVLLDTTQLDIDGVIAEMKRIIGEKIPL